MNETLKAYVAEQALTAVGARRLLKLANFLHTMPRAKFNFRVIIDESGKPPLEALKAGEHKCGTVGCAIGWMPAVFPRDLLWTSFHADSSEAQQVELRKSRKSDFYAAAEYFGLSQSEAKYLFSPNGVMYTSEEDRCLRHTVGAQATPKDVAQHIRNFVRANYVGKAKLDFA